MSKASSAEPRPSSANAPAVEAQSCCAQTPPWAALAAESRAGARPRGTDRSLWLSVAGGFLLLGVVWAVLFTVARSAHIESVPLQTKGGGTR